MFSFGLENCEPDKNEEENPDLLACEEDQLEVDDGSDEEISQPYAPPAPKATSKNMGKAMFDFGDLGGDSNESDKQSSSSKKPDDLAQELENLENKSF